MIVTAGKTNVSVYYYIVQDASATSPGEPVTGLLFSDIETGGSASYVRQGAARVDLTLKTLANAAVAHDDGGFILVDDTNMPGLYRCDYPDAAFITGVDQVFLQIVVASANNAVAAPILVDITDVDLRNAVNGGMSALPAFDADAAGGLPISDAGGLDLDARLDAAITSRLAPTVASRTLDVTTGGNAGLDWGNIVNKTTTNILSGTTIGTVTAFSTAAILSIWNQLTAALSTASTIGKLLVDNINATISSRMAEASINTTGGKVDGVVLVDTTTANTDTAAILGTPADIDSGGATIADNLKKIADNNGGADFVASTDSLEAIRDRGDAAWTTGAGGTPPDLLQSTTITGLTSQTVFNLTAGSADDNAYNGAIAVITDASTSTQKAVGEVDTYVGSSKQVTLKLDPGIFTMANGDTIDLIAAPKQLTTIEADTNELQSDDVPGLIAALNDFNPSSDAVANVTLVATTTLNSDMRGTDGVDTETMRGTDGALTDKAGFSLSTAGILAIWNQLTAALTTASTIGKLLVDNINATISSRSTTTAVTDIQSRIPTALISGKMDSDATALGGSTAAADNLKESAELIIVVTVTGGGSATTVIASGLSAFTPDNILNSRQVYFKDGPAKGATSNIIAFDAGTEELTFGSISAIPVNGNTLVLS